MSTENRSRVTAAIVLAVTLAACSSGPGPLNQPDRSMDRIVPPAVVALAAGWRFGAAGELTVLDHFDPSSIVEGLPASIQNEYAEWGDIPAADALSETIRTAIEDSVPGRQVRFLPVEGAPLAPGDPRCSSPKPFEDGGFVELAVLPGRAVHGDVYLVVARAHDGCGTRRWSAVRMLWQATGLVGGEWSVGGTIDGGESRR